MGKTRIKQSQTTGGDLFLEVSDTECPNGYEIPYSEVPLRIKITLKNVYTSASPYSITTREMHPKGVRCFLAVFNEASGSTNYRTVYPSGNSSTTSVPSTGAKASSWLIFRMDDVIHRQTFGGYV
jgi:hypothetical protein